ncbi:MAG TPA: prolipoprotein diacylglyceryl transferase [Elusimicrobiota bacterium]|nr:prolipoprotein diacylglyceryl transferase [Elusimicrobiota bacterium]
MHPILLRFHSLTLHTYGLLVAFGFLAGYWIALRNMKRAGLSPSVSADLLWLLFLSGLLGARLAYVATAPAYYLAHPWETLKIWEGGLVWYGGFIAAVAVGYHTIRRKGLPALTVADALAPALALGHAIGRVGCFMAGCCYGKPTGLPWAVEFRHPESLAPLNLPSHPVQLYEASLGGILFILLMTLSRKDSWHVGSGRPALLYVFSYAVLRFLLEFLRGDDRGPSLFSLSGSQAVSVALMLVCGGIVVFLRRRSHG